jgi:hypothetical protein
MQWLHPVAKIQHAHARHASKLQSPLLQKPAQALQPASPHIRSLPIPCSEGLPPAAGPSLEEPEQPPQPASQPASQPSRHIHNARSQAALT